MTKQRNKNAKKKLYLLIALGLALILSSGTFAYTYVTSFGTIGVTPPTTEFATCNTAASQPDWSSVLTSENYTETLRPNAAGTYSQCDPVGDSPNYACVDEVVSDNDTTHVETFGGATEIDTYNIPDHSEGSGTINSVRIYVRTRATTTADLHAAETVIRTHSTDYFGTYTLLPLTYTVLSTTYINNPNTNNAWTWDEIDALEIGVRQYDNGSGGVYTTQVYVEVNYGVIPTNGDVPTGDLFTVHPNPRYSGDVQVGVYLTNAGELIKAYQYLNMQLYMEGSVSSNQTPNYRLLTLQNGQTTLAIENLAPVFGSFYQTSQSDFESGNLTNLDTTTSPGNVILDTFADNVTDNFTDESKIAYKNNVIVSDSQVKLIAGGTPGTETFRPNAAGDDTDIASQYPDSGAHWDKVDEVTADNYTTYIYTSSAWYNSDWQYRKKITINSANVSGDLTDFPVLISITDTDLRDDAKSDGSDIVFTASDGTTKLKREIESYDNSDGTLVAWVKTDLSSSTDTEIYLYYGYAGASETNDTDTWDTNFKMVQHMTDNTTSSIEDSTSNNNDGTKTGTGEPAVTTSGQIDDAQYFDGSNDEIDCQNAASLQITENLTIEAWCKPDATGVYEGIAGKLVYAAGSYAGYSIVKHDTNYFRFFVASAGSTDFVSSDSAYADTNWHYIVGLRSGGTNYLYVDGVLQTDNSTQAVSDSGDDFRIGRQYADYDGRWWDGIIDEVRVSDIARNTAWIETSYNNQSNPSDFHSVGSEESTAYERDLYNIPDHSTGTGLVDNVTAYFRFANSATTKWGIVYRGPADDGFLKTAEITTNAQISETIIDTLEWDTAQGMQPDIIHIAGNIYAIPYSGDGDDGWLVTVEVDNSGNITDTIIDSFEFDPADCDQPEIIHVSGNIYAIAYNGPGGDGWLCTVEIDSAGNITNSIIDSLEFESSDCDRPEITHVSGNIYAIAYNGPAFDGWLCTVEIDSAGNIANSIIDSLEFDTGSGFEVDIIHVSGDVYAIAYRGVGNDGWLVTVEIDSSGNITDTVIDSFEWDTANGYEPDIINISGDVYAIAYRGTGADGWLVTVDIYSSGNITDTVTDSFEWDTADGWEPNMAHVTGNNYAIAYRAGGSDLGYLITVEVATDGQITDGIIDTLQFDTYGYRPKLILVSSIPGNVYARAAVKTYGSVYTGTEESTATDAFVTRAYTWSNNPNTGSPWTWDEIDDLQIGVELKANSITDIAVCTQVYLEVDYTPYSSPGTLTSINLLSGEVVSSIDIFNYNASAIPSGTGLKVQYSTDNTTWYNSAGTPGGWDTMSEGTDNFSLSGLGWSGPNFYYNMEFTSDGSDTPVLDLISVIFSTYYSSGNLTSSNYDTGDDLAWDWEYIYFTINEPGTTDIKFQIRSAATEAGLSTATWYGPTGTGDYYTTSGTDINSVHDGDRWIQYRADFSGPGDDTPTLSDIRLTYTVSALTYIIEVSGGSYGLVSANTSDWAEGWTITPEFYCDVTQR